MQQPDTVSMCNTAIRHPYPHATARHSQLHLLGHTAHDLVPLEGVCHVLLSETALLRPSPAHVTSHEGWHHRLGKISQIYKYRYTNVWLCRILPISVLPWHMSNSSSTDERLKASCIDMEIQRLLHDIPPMERP